MSTSAAANPASRGFSLAWLSALTNSFTSILCRVVGLCAGYRIKKNTLYSSFRKRWFRWADSVVSCGRRLIYVESFSLCCFRNIRIREDGVLELPQVVLTSSTAEKAVKRVGRAV